MLTQLKLAAKSNPYLFSLLWRLQENGAMKRRVVKRGDAAVIEGFPRSANTFATYAFQEAQGKKLSIGNHFHSPAQISLAKLYGVPAMVVVRRPADAILSFLVFSDGISYEEAALRYADFHERILRSPDSFVVALFEEVTTDFGVCIRRMNRYFGTSFAVFDHSPAADKAVKNAIERDRLARLSKGGDQAASSMRSTVPSAAKDAKKAALASEAKSPGARAALARANRAYEQMVSHPSLSGER